MTQRFLTLAAAAVIGFGLLVSAGNAANPCKKDCAQSKVACLQAAKAAKKACTGDKVACKTTYKAAKKACLDKFKADKVKCKDDKENTNICSPSGAFLN